MTDLFRIGLSSWVIADGNYSDFVVGQVRSFALEYANPVDFRPTDIGQPSSRSLHDAIHAVSGKTIHVASSWCVIDVGVLAYRQLHTLAPPPPFFDGEAYIGIDPFFYFERFADEPDAPALIYDWRIYRIEVETAPRILQDGMWIYDPDRLKRVDVKTTKQGEDFVLHCERLAPPPSRRRVHV